MISINTCWPNLKNVFSNHSYIAQAKWKLLTKEHIINHFYIL